MYEFPNLTKILRENYKQFDIIMDNSSSDGRNAWEKKPRERIFPDNISSSDNINSDSKRNSKVQQPDSCQSNSQDEIPGGNKRIGARRSKNNKNVSISDELAFINQKYKSILQSQEERILYRPVKAYKLKPKNIMRMFQAKWRYLMFTNRRLYTLISEAYEDGSMLIADRLIANKIDIDFLSHLIFIPKFIFDSYEMFDVSKLKKDENYRRQAIVKEMKQKRCKIIVGFKQGGVSSHYKFNESDIALETTMWTVLQIIHSCQLVNMLEISQEFNSQLQNAASQSNALEKQKSQKNIQRQATANESQMRGRESRFSRHTVDTDKARNRGTGSRKSYHNPVDQIQYFPVFMVKNKKYSSDALDERQSIVVAPRSNSSKRNSSRSKSGLRNSLSRLFSQEREHYNLKQFYRAKNSDAEIKIGENPEVLQRVDTKYYCELFWALEPQSQPEIIKNHFDQLEMSIQQQKMQQTQDSQAADDNKNNQTGVFGQSPMPLTNMNSNYSTNQQTGLGSNTNVNARSSNFRNEDSPATLDNQFSRNRASIKTQQKQNHLQSCLVGNNNSLDRNMSTLDAMHKRHTNNNVVNVASALQNTLQNVSNSYPRTEPEQSSKQVYSKQPYLIPYFNLEELRSYKPYIQPSGNLKHDVEVQKIKIYKPFIIQNQVQLEFRNGDFIFLGARISRPLQDVNSIQVQQLIYEKSQIFDEELIDIFPVLSQPKVFLREQVSYEQNKNPVLHHAQITPQPQIQHSLYFGFLIPKFKKSLPLDLNNLSNYIGFKHGLMLLYQFIDFMLRIHRKDHKFGHFDLSNLYFVENRGDQNNQINQYLIAAQAAHKKNAKRQGTNESENSSMKKSGPSGSNNSMQKKAPRFSLELLFIEKNLQNLAILQNNQVLNQSYLNRYISQVTEQEQEQFTAEHLYQDFFCVQETLPNKSRDVSKSRERSKSRENRWSARSNHDRNERSKSDPRSISQHVIDQFKQEIRELQYKIDKMKPNFDKSQNKVEIESLQVFVQVLLQYCHRIQHGQAVSPRKKFENSQKNNQSYKQSSRSPKNSIISNPTSQCEETFDFLRRKDDVMRQSFYYEFMNVFNQHQVRNYSPAQVNSQINDGVSQTSGVKLTNSRISLPQSISNFEEKIFEKQLNDAKKICQNYIDIYENKQYWQNALAIYIEDSQNATGKILQAENMESPNQVEKHSFVSFSNESRKDTYSRALIAQSQQFPSLINTNYKNMQNSGSLCLKRIGHANKKQVQAHMKLLEDMMNMSNNFDNLLSPTRSNNGQGDSKQESKITSNRTQLSGDSYVNQQSLISNNNLAKQSYINRDTEKQSPTNKRIQESKNQSLVSMQFENQGQGDESPNQFDPSSSASPQRHRSPVQPTITPKATKQRIIPKQNQLKNNLRPVDKVSCQEGLDSIVSGVGPRGEQSYINFTNQNQHRLGSKAGFGTLSGIRGAGNEYRNSIRKNVLQKAEQANEKLRSNEKNSLAGVSKQTEQNQRSQRGQKEVKVAKPLGNFREKDSNNAGMKYLVSVKQSKLEDEPISEDDDEDDVDQDKFIQKQKKILASMEIERKYQQTKEQLGQPNANDKKKNQIQKSNGIVHMVPQIQQKSKISSEGKSSSRVSRFGISHVSPDSRHSRHSSPSRSPEDKSRSKLSKYKSTITGKDSQNQNSQSSVLVTSPRLHDRKSSVKLKGLKEAKNKNQISRDENNKEYDDELDDHVDANDIVVSIKKDKMHKDGHYQGRNSLRKELNFQESPQREQQRSGDQDKQQIVGILKNQGSNVRPNRKQNNGHRFKTSNHGTNNKMPHSPTQYQERNHKVNQELAAEVSGQKSSLQQSSVQNYRSQGSLKLNSTQNFLGKALESQNSLRKQSSNQQSSGHFRTEQKTSIGQKSSENRNSFGQSSQSQTSNFKQRQFNLQSSQRGTTSAQKGSDAQPSRKSFRGYKQQQNS